MALDEVAIYNLALNAVGTRNDVSAIDEESREAEVCRLWFGIVRDHVLRAAAWPATRATARLTLLATRSNEAWQNGDPEPGFMFSYAAPSDMVAPRYLHSFGRFLLSTRGAQLSIETQDEGALLSYTKRQENVGLWDPQLQMAIVHALAAFIAMPLHGKASRAAKAEQTANDLILQARVSAANSDDNQYDTMPDWITARGYSGSYPTSRYYYPLGPMISVSEMRGVS